MKQTFWFFNTQLTIETEGGETDDRYDLVDGIIPPGIETPLHMHTKYSENIFVLEGEFTLFIPGQTKVLHAGDRFLIPAGTPHVLINSGEIPARGLTVASPSGFAKLIRNGGTIERADPSPMNDEGRMEDFAQASRELGDVIMGPPGARP